MKLEVHKFGGAAVRDAAGVRNVARIVGERVRNGVQPVVVVSAMAKSTNALEKVWGTLPTVAMPDAAVEEVRAFHFEVLEELGLSWKLIKGDWAEFMRVARELCGADCSDAGYDALVGFGELFSTRIVHAQCAQEGQDALWWSAWEVIRTDSGHRAASVDLEVTHRLLRKAFGSVGSAVVVTQGFVGGTSDGIPTTLGREGSDFSAALLAEALGAERLVVWKDVPGVMTGDPRQWPLAKRIARLDHRTAERMSLAGAGVLHPSTMAPLQRSEIPLEVRSFLAPERIGTIIEGAAPEHGGQLLWAFAVDEGGQPFARCLSSETDKVIKEWNKAFGDRPIVAIGPDPEMEDCLRLAWMPESE